MKKLLVGVALVLSLAGCKTACTDASVVFGCKGECHRTVNPKKCACDDKEPCCGYKKDFSSKIIVSPPE